MSSVVLFLFLLHPASSQGPPPLLQVLMSRGVEESAWSSHPGLAGLYWLSEEESEDSPVYRKLTGRSGWLYRRGRGETGGWLSL